MGVGILLRIMPMNIPVSKSQTFCGGIRFPKAVCSFAKGAVIFIAGILISGTILHIVP